MIDLDFNRIAAIGRGSLLALLLSPLLPLAIAPAAAQTSAETQVLLERINRLESDLNTLQRQVYRGGGTQAPPPSAGQSGAAGNSGLTSGSGETVAARLQLRLDELEEKISSLTGRIEEVDHRSQEVSSRLDKLVADVDFRLKALEQRNGTAAAGTTPAETANAGQAATTPAPGAAGTPPRQGPGQPSGVLGTMPAKDLPPGAPTPPPAVPPPADRPVTLPPGSPSEQYNFATRLLHQGDYAQAEQALGQFVAAHPADPLASAAQYWLGETFFARQQYDRAAKAFLAGYQKYPKGSKAPDDLLKLAMSLTNLNQKKEACAVFKQLSTEYPNAEARIKQSAVRERGKAGCTG